MAYIVLIYMDDGTSAVMRGVFPSDFAAIDMGMEMFENALSVVPRRESIHGF